MLLLLPLSMLLPAVQVVKVADAEIQTHHVKNAGDHAVWDERWGCQPACALNAPPGLGLRVLCRTASMGGCC